MSLPIRCQCPLDQFRFSVVLVLLLLQVDLGLETVSQHVMVHGLGFIKRRIGNKIVFHQGNHLLSERNHVPFEVVIEFL